MIVIAMGAHDDGRTMFQDRRGFIYLLREESPTSDYDERGVIEYKIEERDLIYIGRDKPRRQA